MGTPAGGAPALRSNVDLGSSFWIDLGLSGAQNAALMRLLEKCDQAQITKLFGRLKLHHELTVQALSFLHLGDLDKRLHNRDMGQLMSGVFSGGDLRLGVVQRDGQVNFSSRNSVNIVQWAG